MRVPHQRPAPTQLVQYEGPTIMTSGDTTGPIRGSHNNDIR